MKTKRGGEMRVGPEKRRILFGLSLTILFLTHKLYSEFVSTLSTLYHRVKTS